MQFSSTLRVWFHSLSAADADCMTVIVFSKQGILLLKPEITPDGSEGFQKIVRLWVHEVYRVFYDRLVDGADRSSFFSVVKVCAFNLL